MSAGEQKRRSPVQAALQWCRDWASGSESELKCCAEDEIQRVARDTGMSVSELRMLSEKGPHAADLLLKRMDALQLDPREVARMEPATLQDLQRVCSMCNSQRRCTRDLAHDAADPAWQDYCPNAQTLKALNALPWSARSEW
jgi:hypothetical protein